MTKIKFCGLTRAADATAAVSAGASYLGVIFAGGPRCLTSDAAASVLEASGEAKRVGVFGDQSTEEIARIAAEVALDVVQLHGDTAHVMAPAVRASTGCETWVAMRILNTLDEKDLNAYISSADAILFDTRVEGTLGGSGRPFDWSIVTNVLRPHHRERASIVLAGGLDPENVAFAIAAMHPDVVDVSSGIEQAPGVKDHNRMHAFAAAVRSAR